MRLSPAQLRPSIRHLKFVLIGVFTVVFVFKWLVAEPAPQSDLPQSASASQDSTLSAGLVAAMSKGLSHADDVIRDTQVFLDNLGTAKTFVVDHRVHAFYYSWYGNPSNNGKYIHWNHKVLVTDGKEFQAPEDIGSTFWPALGLYSSKDPSVVNAHFAWMAAAGVGTACVTWWGDKQDEQGERGMTDEVLPLLFAAAELYGMRISFHIEPYPRRDARNVAKNIDYIYETYSQYPAFLPWFFIYDSYLTTSNEWAELLLPGGSLGIRSRHADAVFIGLVVENQHLQELQRAGFDGIYTYFAADGFVWGSTRANWKTISTFADQNHLIFVPCVGPGYDDERIRPWNSRNTHSRSQGAYYDASWKAAMDLQPGAVGITSFNEWHEGTQIEPAVAHSSSTHKYLDYSTEGDPDYYMAATAKWIGQYLETR
eukprot:ANDGO_07171.mRNA.1 Glycoprotein endo-alpha-1